VREPRAHRGAWALAALLLALVLPGCGGPEAPPLQRLFGDGTPVTLPPETRLARAPDREVVWRREFESLDALPETAAVPRPLAGAQHLLLTYRSWTRRPGPFDAKTPEPPRPERHTVVAPVRREGGEARVALPDLREYAGSAPVGLRVTALPVPPARLHRVRVPVAVPQGARLDLGYGVRQEAWVPEAPPARFRVEFVAGDGVRRTLLAAEVDPTDPEQRRWHDARVDLADLAGRRGTLELVTECPGDADPCLPVFADPTLHRPGPGERPNLVIVSLDTLRARSLGTYGYSRDTSPFLDALARRSTLFEDAVTTSVTTSPSHMSLFTGLYPVHHGVMRGLERKLPQVPTLAEILRAAGYETAAFTENGYLVRAYGFGSGFARYTENKAMDMPGRVRLTFGQARRWLAAAPREPFLLFVHTYEVHSPFDPDPPYQGLFADDRLPGPEDPRRRAERDDYDREIRYLDDELRGLFEALAAEGLEESTLVVVLSDHGEEFWEHGGFLHGAAVYEETLHVPLLFYGPGRIPEGRRVPGQVSLVDVAPTLLDLAGVPAPEGLDGRSLAPVIRQGEPVRERTLFAEARAAKHWVDISHGVPVEPPVVAVRRGDRKFVVHHPAEGPARPMELYDLASDPDESDPLPIDPQTRAEVRALVAGYLRGRVPDEVRREELLDENPELRERLRALGYVE